MKSFKLAVILGLALFAGCTFSAGISRGQEINRSILFEQSDFRTVMNATCRIKAFKNNKLAWLGSGTAFEVSASNKLMILSNNHVVSGADKLTVEFWKNGDSLGEYVAEVELAVERTNIDIGVISVDRGTVLASVPTIPLKGTDTLKVGDEIFQFGADGGYQPNGALGDVVEVLDGLIIYTPHSSGGDSGSSIFTFDENGSPQIAGLVAWQLMQNGTKYGMAMKSNVVKQILETESGVNDGRGLGLRDERGIIRELLARLIELRKDSEFFKAQLEQEQENTRLFRDLWRKNKADRDEDIERIEGNQDSLSSKLLNQFEILKAAVKLLKLSFYALIGLLVASIFFQSGWATKVILGIFKFVFRTAKLAYVLVNDAIVSKTKNPETMSEAIDNLKEEISEEIESGGSGS